MNAASDGVGPGEQLEIWSRIVLFGEDARGFRGKSIATWAMPEYDYLPRILQQNGARGWLAEGLSRLYCVESVTSSFEGTIERLEVGPATSSSIRLAAQFQVATHDRDLVKLEGLVPLIS